MNSEAHAHSLKPYVIVFVALLILLAIGVVCGDIENTAFMNLMVFGTAGIKAVLVARYFMHLKDEPFWISIMLVSAVLLLVVLFALVSPDVAHHSGWDR